MLTTILTQVNLQLNSGLTHAKHRLTKGKANHKLTTVLIRASTSSAQANHRVTAALTLAYYRLTTCLTQISHMHISDL